MSSEQRPCPACGRVPVDADARFCPHDGTPIDADPWIGSVLDGRYRILSRLGEGGFAVVYLARHERLGIDVAIKTLRTELAHREQVVARFAREARDTSRIDHDNVVRVLDFGCAAGGVHYFASEYIAGSPLHLEVQRSGGLTPLRTVHIAAQIAAGVGRAHALGIVHRDLKPENVMLCRRGNDPDFVKVLDFGIATASDGAERLTSPGLVLGTAHYMAPEQWTGDPVDLRVDVYALGAIVFELLTGRPPFDGPMGTVFAQHATAPPPLITALRPKLAAGARFDELITRAMAKRAEDRHPSMEAFSAALGTIMAEVGRPSGRTTYAKSMGVGPRGMPDATAYQSHAIDLAWDGATLCDELRTLHLLRGRRLAELAEVLWPQGWPEDGASLRAQADALEDQIEDVGADIGLLEERLERVWERGRKEDARLRLEMIDANMAMAAALDRFPPEVLTTAGVRLAGPATEPSEAREAAAAPRPRLGAAADPGEPLRRAEQRLQSQLRKQQRTELSLQDQIAEKLARLAVLEREVAPLFEEIAERVRRASARQADLRPAVMAYAQVDGALASYQALLWALEQDG